MVLYKKNARRFHARKNALLKKGRFPQKLQASPKTSYLLISAKHRKEDIICLEFYRLAQLGQSVIQGDIV